MLRISKITEKSTPHEDHVTSKRQSLRKVTSLTSRRISLYTIRNEAPPRAIVQSPIKSEWGGEEGGGVTALSAKTLRARRGRESRARVLAAAGETGRERVVTAHRRRGNRVKPNEQNNNNNNNDIASLAR